MKPALVVSSLLTIFGLISPAAGYAQTSSENTPAMIVGGSMAVGGALVSLVGVLVFSVGAREADGPSDESPVFQAGAGMAGGGLLTSIVGAFVVYSASSSYEGKPTPSAQASRKAREPNWLRGEF